MLAAPARGVLHPWWFLWYSPEAPGGPRDEADFEITSVGRMLRTWNLLNIKS